MVDLWSEVQGRQRKEFESWGFIGLYGGSYSPHGKEKGGKKVNGQEIDTVSNLPVERVREEERKGGEGWKR